MIKFVKGNKTTILTDIIAISVLTHIFKKYCK